MLKKGDKVRRRGTNIIGVIKKIDEPLYFVKWLEYEETPVVGCGWYSADVIKLVTPKITAADLFELKAQIDFALDTRNEKKFLELSTKYRDLSTKHN